MPAAAASCVDGVGEDHAAGSQAADAFAAAAQERERERRGEGERLRGRESREPGGRDWAH